MRSSFRRLLGEGLEHRRLLAGDVSVSSMGGDLILRGDAEANQVEVRLNADGDVTVYGLNGTTLNGSEDPITLFEGSSIPDDARVYLRSGDDSILFEGVSTNDDLIVVGGRGDDAIGLYQTEVGDDARIYSGSGEDRISIDASTIEDDLTLSTSRGEDIIGIDDSLIEDQTLVFSGGGDDQIVVRNSIHQGRVHLFSGGGDDFISLDGAELHRSAFVGSGRGEDDVAIASSQFQASVFAFGGRGRDNLAVDEDTNFEHPPRTFGFGGSDVENAAERTDSALLSLVESGARRGTIVELAQLTPELSSLVDALVAASTEELDLVSTLSSDGPFTVFAPLNSAFAELDEVPTGEALVNVLLFHVAAQRLEASDVIGRSEIAMINGNDLQVEVTDSGVQLNGGQAVSLVQTDIRAKNGIIHLIDGVLLPPSE